VENLSALFETVLLLATSGWIIHEAIQRLFYKSVHVETSIWAFVVMGTSIAIDYTRSRMLYRAAKKHNSQALEADALHFSTDIWSSAVVILGLTGVWLSRLIGGLDWMAQADAVAALVVALIVIFVSAELGWRTIQALLDTAPKGIADQIVKGVAEMNGIEDCHAVRVRPSGARWFVDLHVTMDGNISLSEAHDLTEKIEKQVHSILPESDVTVHAEPPEAIDDQGL
jgi:cation diffusion facilitator family transporter